MAAMTAQEAKAVLMAYEQVDKSYKICIFIVEEHLKKRLTKLFPAIL
jgi:hypothetical protein